MLLALTDLSSRIFGLTRDSQAAMQFNKSVAQDIESLDTAIKQVVAGIGEPIPIGGNMNPNIWTALDSLFEHFNDSDNLIQNRLKSLTKILDLLDKSFGRHKSQQNRYWESLKPWITRINVILHKEELHPLDKLSTRIHNLENSYQPLNSGQPQTVSQHQNISTQQDSDDSETFAEFLQNIGSPNQLRPTPAVEPIPPPSQYPDLSKILERMKTIEDAMKSLADRASSELVSFGQFVFHTPKNLSDWIGTQLRVYRYGYFVDGVSIWQFFFIDHRDTDAVTSAVDKHIKAGYATVHEAYVSACFQNVLPSLLGSNF